MNGIPLVARTIRAALDSQSVGAVYVSSDDEKILAAGRQAGAQSIIRPQDISSSTASSESALLHALDEITRTDGKAPDVLVFLQCTSPFTTGAEIDAVVKAVTDGADCAFSAVEDHGFIWKIEADGTAAGITHDHRLPRQRRQDMTPRYRENGAIYVMRVEPFRKVGNRFCGVTRLVPIDSTFIEIDTNEDWLIAEAYARVHEAPKPAVMPKGPFKALVTDFDGVHTDDLVTVHQDGTEAVTCSRADGMGIELLRKSGLKLLILSKETNPVVQARAAKLKMEVQGSVEGKLAALDVWRQANGLEWSEVVYIGNDINDRECMQACGFAAAPADARPEICDLAHLVLDRPGGKGALRALSDYLLTQRLI
jgi:N-acylneuraminate cytidylyltransferase